MKRIAGVLLLIVAIIWFAPAHGQDGMAIESSLLVGKVIKHSPKFHAPIPDLSAACDVNLCWQTCGRKDWQLRRRCPMVGLGITYTDYGNSTVFGECIGINVNLQIPLIRRDSWEWTLRIGDGAGYVTRKYQSGGPNDTVNNAIGSNINDFALFMTDVRYHFNDHWHWQVGLNFTHISNADYHQPNLGVNMLGAHVGIRYYPGTCHPVQHKRELPALNSRYLVQGRLGIAWNEARATGNPILPTYIATAFVSRRWLGKNKLFAGTDFSYHENIYAFLKTYGVDYQHEAAHSWKGAVFVGNEFLMGRVGITMQVGFYYRQAFLKQDIYYQKIGGNFYLLQREYGCLKELFISGLLKTHKFVAEFAEFGVGVGF